MSQQLNQFKALLFDVDGTLLDSNYNFSDKLISIITKVHKKGYVVGICTGRSFHAVEDSILPVFADIDPGSFHIVSGGAELVNAQGEIFFQQTIPPQLVHSLINLIKPESRFKAASHEFLYLQDAYIKDYQNNLSREVRPISTYQDEPITTVHLYEVKPDNSFLSQLKDQLQIKFMISNEGINYAEITAHNTNKAVGLKQWSRLTQIPADKVIGFGDNHNDLEFIQAAGFKVVMGNAVDELKQIADQVIGDADEDGLLHYLQRIVQNKELLVN